MEKVLVLGAGTMGGGIAQVFAQAGYRVLLYDIQPKFLDAGLERLRDQLERRVEKGGMTGDEKDHILGNIQPMYTLVPDGEVKLALEAVTENMETKEALFKSLNWLTEDAVMASNTSALSITELASKTNRPENFIGLHFFNPPSVMKLVEIIKGMRTSEKTLEKAKRYIEKTGKNGIIVDESPGFAANRMLVPLINEACFLLSEGVASAQDIDNSMKWGANHPLGPLELADLIGIDVCLSVMETLYVKFGDTKYRPCPLMRKMTAAGYLGRKTGQGFYTY